MRPTRDVRLVAATWSGFVLAASISVAQTQACGSNAQSSIATDRPQITNSSVVVPCGSVQFESGLQVTGAGGRQGVDLPEISARIGAARRTELRFSLPDYFQEQAGVSGANGFGDTSLGLKQQLGPIKGFDVSAIFALSLPSGAEPVSSHGYDATVQVPWSRSLTKNWTAAGQFGVAWPTSSGKHDATGQGSVYFDRQLSSSVDAFLEYADGFPQRGEPQHQIDFGAAYKPTPHQ